uniref:Uncharacterized protein n=1 Tax=Romanomermis culicivorax TaxID=13658 RepID=A0A915IA10_ROMCU
MFKISKLKVTEFDCLRASPTKFYLNPQEKKKVKLQFLQYDSEVFTLSKTETNGKYPLWFVFALAQTHEYNPLEDHIFAMEDACPADYCRIVPDDQWTMHILDVDLPPEVTKEPAKKRPKESYAEVILPLNKKK